MFFKDTDKNKVNVPINNIHHIVYQLYTKIKTQEFQIEQIINCICFLIPKVR